MSWNLQNDRPIYLQLVEHLQRFIISGKYPIGSKLPSVRELASLAAVNPNTMQKALAELERSGLVYTNRTSGRFITEDQNMIQNMKLELATQLIKEFLQNMKQLGFQYEDTISLLNEMDFQQLTTS